MRGKTITVVTYADDRIELLDGNKTLNFRVFDTKKHGSSAVDDKELNFNLDQLVTRRNNTKTIPTKDHPWRSFRLHGSLTTRKTGT